MLDIKWIKEHPEEFTAAMQTRNFKVDVAEILELDERRRKLLFDSKG